VLLGSDEAINNERRLVKRRCTRRSKEEAGVNDDGEWRGKRLESGGCDEVSSAVVIGKQRKERETGPL
jgi:hypothetical protein